MAPSSDRVAFVLSILNEVGGDPGLRVRVNDMWLELTASFRPDPGLRASELWNILARNTTLSGSIRVALGLGRRPVHLRADLSLEDGSDDDLEERVVGLYQEFRACGNPYSRGGHSSRPRIDSTAPTSLDARRMAELCAGAGWPCSTRAGGEIVVSLPVGSESHVARIEPGRGYALDVVVDLFDGSQYSLDSRAATALVLLSTSAIVRSVKGVVRLNDGVETGALMASCTAPVTGPALHRAFASLSVACQLVGREVQALSDEALAREFLAWRGWEAIAPDSSLDETDVNFVNHTDHVGEDQCQPQQ